MCIECLPDLGGIRHVVLKRIGNLQPAFFGGPAPKIAAIDPDELPLACHRDSPTRVAAKGSRHHRLGPVPSRQAEVHTVIDLSSRDAEVAQLSFRLAAT
jgi:hypothetical protein